MCVSKRQLKQRIDTVESQQNEETYETTNRADKNCYYGVVENDNRLILRYRTVGYDQSKVLHQDLLFECQLFKMN